MKTKWCKWAGKQDTSERCKDYDLYKDCPVTCDACGECIDRMTKWKIGGTKRKWCKWAGKQDTLDICEDLDLYKDCPVTCKVCTP